MSIKEKFAALPVNRKLEVLRKLRDMVNSDILKINTGKEHKCKYNYISTDFSRNEESNLKKENRKLTDHNKSLRNRVNRLEKGEK